MENQSITTPQVNSPARRDIRVFIVAENRQSGQTLFDDWYDPPFEPEPGSATLGLAVAALRVVRGWAAAGLALDAAFFLAAGAAAAGLAAFGVAAALFSGAVPSVLALRIEAIS